jgi:hypothetical protein
MRREELLQTFSNNKLQATPSLRTLAWGFFFETTLLI